MNNYLILILIIDIFSPLSKKYIMHRMSGYVYIVQKYSSTHINLLKYYFYLLYKWAPIGGEGEGKGMPPGK